MHRTREINGAIDQLAIYTTALSDARVLAHHKAAMVIPGTMILMR